jgi:hypothetical protein
VVVAIGQVTAACKPCHRRQEFLAFLTGGKDDDQVKLRVSFTPMPASSPWILR